MKKKVNNTNLFIVQGDALKERSDMLVNWTVPRLNGGDALFFRIHEQGGSTIYRDCQRVLANLNPQRLPNQGETIPDTGTVPIGKAVVTTAGVLPSKFVVHVVIPDYRIERLELEHEQLLSSAINSALLLVTQYNSTEERINKIIFTPVPSFIYGSAHNSKAAETLVSSLLSFAATSSLRTIKIVCETPEDYQLYAKEMYKQTSSKFERFINKLFKLSV
jgi:O-acetyl-ADP-ribose deacetylase (regulator of RNase III)